MYLISLAALVLLMLASIAHELAPYQWRHQCPQLGPLFPGPRNLNENNKVSGLDEYLKSKEFFNTSVARLSGAWSELPGNDPVWTQMGKFRDYLRETFPSTHRYLDLENINEHGLLYTWKGNNPSLKPTLLLAHQDVVPVPDDTILEWTHHPFSGDFDETYVWGRGAFDCKTTLIAIMSTVEELLKVGWKPQRTLILAFGFDEEISGFQGAMKIAQRLEEQYGRDGIALLIDEGPGIQHHVGTGTTCATPALSEKGSFNANISVHMTSGHSSSSDGHNSITVMSALIGKIHATQLPAELQTDDIFLQSVFCAGQHVPSLPPSVIGHIQRIDQNESVINDILQNKSAMKEIPQNIRILQPFLKPLVGNKRTVAKVEGGVKVNMVPERTTLSINHRLLLGTSVKEAKSALEKIVKKHIENINEVEGGTNLTFRGWSEEETVNSIKLTAFPGELEASPTTPFAVDGQTPYGVLQATIRSLYDDQNLTFVAPIPLPANTDSRHYWNLTQHIFRFSPGHDMTDPTDNYIGSGIHNTNERVNVLGHVNGVRWFSLFIQNMDNADLI
ncbi:hypothetical protein KVR01_002801 [Diaporthe batatas]|uniref:uncharacterized protein n=1 Tax=Diaporthe batatas TaxID=748121 RepID=UPI001D036A2D|nr:uncharacterized protein KVR01_002801 [Diaporthe batatas]KAG8167112.1 hypothetical protein KVR01_002801 [Diaporthe batatas]